MSKYLPTIGLEIHTELNTKTKIFCRCLNDSFEKNPNINICPICLAHPGVLPTINKKAVELVLKLGLALNSCVPEISKFDRKSYFYPDLPKGYQISQYDLPLCIGGYLDFSNGLQMTSNESRMISDESLINNNSNKIRENVLEENSRRIRIRRIHLEEDTARLIHNNSLDVLKPLVSLVDFNRAGVPLMELVTEPDIKNAKEAVAFAKELQLILRYLEISNADMEKGQMRVEVNISLSQISNFKSQKLGTKVEIKNLNSFRAVEKAIEYEIERQTKVLESGKKIIQETRGWDDVEDITVPQREKEEAHDYRYLPEPDLPQIIFSNFARISNKTKRISENNSNLFADKSINFIDFERLKIETSELPAQKRIRFSKEYGLMSDQIEILVENKFFAQYFEESVSELLNKLSNDTRINSDDTQITNLLFDKNSISFGEDSRKNIIQLLYNYFSSDLRGLMNEHKIKLEDLKITPKNFSDLIVLIFIGHLSSRSAKDILKEMLLTGRNSSQITGERGLKQISDEKIIEQVIEEAVSENLKAIEDYKNGKENAIQFLVGQIMKKLKGRANPQILRKLLENYLSSRS
ncbi:MAG: Asp-tRNA(Asn)/Glu-tRNA(Gln) amidotransferase subunit GatB [Candidatus Liptonbacteria bacterium]|nr:Asp-tRNA(Asn)/Glu-tRNA(Gln) amidotransferase subunit GatB [Candidatus Liptonbacteria bacterium]